MHDVARFLDDLDDLRLDPVLRAILDEVDSQVRADDYRRYLDRNIEFLLRKNQQDFDYRDNLYESLINKEISRRARVWNSKIDQPASEDDYRFPEKEGFRDSENA